MPQLSPGHLCGERSRLSGCNLELRRLCLPRRHHRPRLQQRHTVLHLRAQFASGTIPRNTTGPCPAAPCPPGFSPGSPATATAQCVPCPDGTFSLGNVSACRAWTNCAATQVVTVQPTSSSDRQCGAPNTTSTGGCRVPVITSVSPQCGAQTIHLNVTGVNINAMSVIHCKWWHFPCSDSPSLVAETSATLSAVGSLGCPLPTPATMRTPLSELLKGETRLTIVISDSVTKVSCSSHPSTPAGLENSHLRIRLACDTTAPNATTCPNLTLGTLPGTQTARLGADVNLNQLTVNVADDQDCPTNFTFYPPQSSFALGTTRFGVNVSDSAGNTRVNACMAVFNVIDTDPPAITCPRGNPRLTLGADGTLIWPCVVNNNATTNCLGVLASDNVGVVRLQQTPPPNSSLTWPMTIINITAWDARGNNATCSIPVVVNDVTPPRITCPSSMEVDEDPVLLVRNVSVRLRAWDNAMLSVYVVTLLPSGYQDESSQNGLQMVATSLRGNVNRTFDVVVQVAAGTTQTFQATAYDGTYSTAQCSFNVTVLRSQLTSALLSLESTPVSQIDPVLVRNITQDAENMTALQASIVVNVVSQLVATANATTAPAIFSALDNLNALPADTIEASESASGSASRIREAVLTFAMAISATQDGTQVLEGESLKIVTTAANASNLPTFTFNDSSSSSSAGAEPGFAARLAPDALAVNASRVVALFSLFRDDRMFPTSGANGSSSTETVASAVVDVTILGATLNGSLEFSVRPTGFAADKPFRCVFWSVDDNVWNDSGLTTSVTAAGVDCESVHLTNFAVLVDSNNRAAVSSIHGETLSAISLIGCCLSIFGLVCTIGVHGTVRKLRESVPSKLLINLSSVLTVSLILFIFATHTTSPRGLCQTWGVLLHYSWLCAFGWMLVQGINMHAICVIVLGLSWDRRLPAYYVGAYGVPAIIVALSIIIAGIDSYGDTNFCWINSRSLLIGGFLIPLGVVVLVNSVLFVVIVTALHNAANKRRSDIGGLKTQSLARELKAIVAVFVLLGLAWVFGAFINVKNETTSLAFQYLFAIFVTLQGLAIFLLQCVFSESVREYRASARSKTSSSKTPMLVGQKLVGFNSTSVSTSVYQESLIHSDADPLSRARTNSTVFDHHPRRGSDTPAEGLNLEKLETTVEISPADQAAQFLSFLREDLASSHDPTLEPVQLLSPLDTFIDDIVRNSQPSTRENRYHPSPRRLPTNSPMSTSTSELEFPNTVPSQNTVSVSAQASAWSQVHPK
eukprot:m.115946 g.115946  ORF g.115946 m.115946 type:complete len:1259 (-) comp14456_c1_seq4:176-3952(-)